MTLAWIVLAIGAASVVACLVRRKWIDAALVVVASAALAGMIGGFSLPAQTAAQAPLKVEGDGLSAAQWRDMPARAIAWAAPQGAVLRLDFPRQLTLGRMFALTVHRSDASAGRLQLLAENDQVIAEGSGSGNSLTVQWLPPVAETLVLKARLLDGGGKVAAQGPVPLTVVESKPLQVLGRFGAPSFDTRVLNELLANSRALVDWQVTLGKTVTRSETAREKMTASPDLLVADAAYLERMPAAARGALLERVAAGAPLIVLASNAGDAGFWARAFQLNLRTNDKESVGAPLAMTPAPLTRASKAVGAWTSSDGMAWVRQWQKGRIVWLGAADWHRYAISEPRALGLWWQQVLDKAGVRRIEEIAWLEPEEMPVAGRRVEVCAQNVQGDVAFPGLAQTLAWQRRPDRADASCVAVWPKQAGWLVVEAKDAKPHALYVYDKGDWPLWQKAQRRDATARYAARTPVAVTATGATTLPAWPFALLFTLAMLGLWWRERR